MIGTNGDDRLQGGGGDDHLQGLGGNDVLIGGAGADRTDGGPGDDLHFVDDERDVVVERPGEGDDRVISTVSYALTAGAEVEGLFAGDGTSGITLVGNEYAQSIYGDAGANLLRGLGGNDYLVGLGGNDTLDGGEGADALRGGTGNDRYLVDHDGDAIYEDAGEGEDLVVSGVDYGLRAGAEVEMLFAADGSAAIDLAGNEYAQSIYGNTGANVLQGLGGNDYLVGLEGNDTLDGGEGADSLRGGQGNDSYRADSEHDRVYEAAGEGDDLVVTSVSYNLSEGAEIEALFAAEGFAPLALGGNEYAQSLHGNAGANVLRGLGGNDYLAGYEGNDTLDGGEGADNLRGGQGNDLYRIDNLGDAIFENTGEGDDVLLSSVSYELRSDAEIELLLAAEGAAAIALTGNDFGQSLYGNAGANVLRGLGGNDYLAGNEGNDSLDGGQGADTLSGGAGNDSYYVDNSADAVLEASGQGDDVLVTSISYTLGAGIEIETMVAAEGTSPIALTGNEFGQSIYGNAGSNVLSGFGGSDYLAGGEGNDTLDGGEGADSLRGGTGNDSYRVDNVADAVFENVGEGDDSILASTSYVLGSGLEVEALVAGFGTAAINLTGNDFGQSLYGNDGDNVLNGGAGSDYLVGGGGRDSFAFTTAIGASNTDTIKDFDVAADKILLAGNQGQPFAALATGSLVAGAFRIGASAADSDDRIIYNSATGALLYDADGSGAGAALQFATLAPGLALTAANFTATGAANNPPVISSASTATVQENTPTSTIVYQAVAQDADGDAVSFTLSGSDASLFTIDPTGAVRFVSSPDYEARSSYSFTVTASDSSGAGSSRTVALSVTDVNDTAPPASPYYVAETSAVNNSIGSAQALDRSQFTVTSNSNLPDPSLPSGTIQGSISSNVDKDFFTVTLKEGELLILDVDGTTGGLDALLRVYGPSGFELVMNDDAVASDPGSTIDPNIGHNLDSLVRFRAPADGTYAFSIESFEQGSAGSYNINVSIGPPASAEQINEENIQALISGRSWGSTSVTYGFTTSASQYPTGEGTDEKISNFEALNSGQQNAVRTVLSQISGVSGLTFTQLVSNPGQAQMRYAMSDDPDTASAYYPGAGNGGDSWYNNSGALRDDGTRSPPAYDNPVVGNYAYMTFLHETGHALGLKHGHESPALSYNRDSMEFSVMTYRGYIGAPTGEEGGYRNETFGFAQTLMMYDIAALQRMYGANFATQSGDTTYSWSSTSGAFMINGVVQWTPGANRVFMTTWDGGGNDTYDLSNYTSNVTIDLRPGEWSTTSSVQLANLGNGNYARGNIANSLLYNNDSRSLIENAVGGSGWDLITANQAANRLTGGAGRDRFIWHSTNDSRPGQADIITDFFGGAEYDTIDLSMIDAIFGTSQNDSFTLIGTRDFSGTAGELRTQVINGNTHIFGDVNGDGIADLEIVIANVTDLQPYHFWL